MYSLRLHFHVHLRNWRCSLRQSSIACTAGEVRKTQTAAMIIVPHDKAHSSNIGPTSRIGDGAVFGSLVEVGKHCDVGNNVALMRNVTVGDFTTIGQGTAVYPNARLGAPPQDRKYRSGDTRLVIGANCVIREGVQIERGTEAGGGLTFVGDSALIMAGTYVGHDCRVEDSVVVANNASIAGHCHLHRGCIIGGHAGLHQRVRVGAHAMVGGMAALRRDVLPYTVVSGGSPTLRSLNFHHLWPQLDFAGRRAALYCFQALFKEGGWRKFSGLLPLPPLPRYASLVERLEALSTIDMGLIMSACQVDKICSAENPSEQAVFLQKIFREIAVFALFSTRRGLYCEA
jgi:UDP-N-acetylglucosamine acyltransferase